MNTYQEHKLAQCVAYIVNGASELTNIKLYKLVWLSDRLHMCKYARTISGDEYFALKKGPVPTKVKQFYDGIFQSDYMSSLISVENGVISLKSIPEWDFLSDTDIKVMDSVLNSYDKYGDEELSSMSHLSPEWIRYKNKFTQKCCKQSYKIKLVDFFQPYNDPCHLFPDKDYSSIAMNVFLGK